MTTLTDEAVKARVAELLAKAKEPGCPVRLPPANLLVSTTFDLKGLAAGMVRMKRVPDGSIHATIRINRKAMAFEDGRFMRDEVIPHEVAHVLAGLIYLDQSLSGRSRSPFKGHGHGWWLLAKWLGASGKRTCDVGLTPSRDLRPFTYKASCGTVVKVTRQRHAKIQSGARLWIRKTGGKLAAEHFVPNA